VRGAVLPCRSSLPVDKNRKAKAALINVFSFLFIASCVRSVSSDGNVRRLTANMVGVRTADSPTPALKFAACSLGVFGQAAKSRISDNVDDIGPLCMQPFSTPVARCVICKLV